MKRSIRQSLRAFMGFCVFAFVCAIALAQREAQSPTKSNPADVGSFTLNAAGHVWNCSVHVPTNYDPTKPTPLVLILHGAGGEGSLYLEKAGWARKADKEGFIALAPDGLPARPSLPANFLTNPRLWNTDQIRANGPRGRIDDIAFFRALLDEAARRWNVDPNRIYVAGHSNGAGMAFRLACELSVTVQTR